MAQASLWRSKCVGGLTQMGLVGFLLRWSHRVVLYPSPTTACSAQHPRKPQVCSRMVCRDAQSPKRVVGGRTVYTGDRKPHACTIVHFDKVLTHACRFRVPFVGAQAREPLPAGQLLQVPSGTWVRIADGVLSPFSPFVRL